MLRNILHPKHLYLSLALIPVVVGIIEIFALIGSPYLGLDFQRIQDKWYISSVASNGPAKMYPELKGKEIVAIGDWHVGKSDLTKVINEIQYPDEYWHFWDTQEYLWEHIQPNKPVVITVMINNISQQYVITASQVSIVHVFSTILGVIYVSAFITLIVGLVVVFNKPENEAARVFFFLTFTISLYTITSGVLFNRLMTFEPVLFKSLYFVSLFGVLLISAVLHFALVFPRRHPVMRYKAIVWLIYIIIAIFTIIFFFRVSFIAYQVVVISQLFYLFGAIGVTIYNYTQITSPTEKAQMKWVVFAFILMVVSGCFVILEQVFFGRFDVHIVMMIFLLFPLSMAFAIMRYKLMDIDTLFDNTLIYSVTIGLLAVIDIVVVYFLTSNKIPLLVFKEPFPTIIAVWVIIFTYLPLRNKVRDVIKRLLRREVYNLNEVSISFGKSLLAAQAIHEISEVTKQVINKTLYPRGVEIELFPSPQPVMPSINTDDGGTFLPLLSTRGALGVINLQRKHSGRLYDKSDIRLLNAIANQTALAIESIHLREGMRRKEEENRAEKERISKEIHDGIGSSLVQAKLLLNMAGKDPAVIHEASNVIDNGIKEMRELIWVVEQDEQTLGDLVYHIEGRLEQAKNILNIKIETIIEDENIVLTPEQKLNISRIVQESITNIIKHAQATKVDISFVQQNKEFMITARDNGKGFDMSKTSSESYGLRNMRARAEKIGAQFSVLSAIGKGSEIRLNVKL